MDRARRGRQARTVRGQVVALATGAVLLSACGGGYDPADDQSAVVELAEGIRAQQEAEGGYRDFVIIDDGSTPRPCPGGSQYRHISYSVNEKANFTDLDTKLDFLTADSMSFAADSRPAGVEDLGLHQESDVDDLAYRAISYVSDAESSARIEARFELRPMGEWDTSVRTSVSTACGSR